MTNRCPDCMKFVSLETQEPEEIELEVDEDTGEVTVTSRMTRNCAECGTEMKEYNFETDGVMPNRMRDESDPDSQPETLAEHIERHKFMGETFILAIDQDTAEIIEETITKDRHGKPIKNFRYMRTEIGYLVTFNVICSCGASFEGDVSEQEPASAWDDLN